MGPSSAPRAGGLILLLLLAFTRASTLDAPAPSSTVRASAVEMSLDRGRTWIPALPPAADTSAAPVAKKVLFRVRDSASFISLPACAASSGPAPVVWAALGTLGSQGHRVCSASDAFDVLYARPTVVRPKWHYFMHAPDASPAAAGNASDGSDNADGKGKKEEKKIKRRGFFSKYGIYIVLFVAISLFQGIREGNAKYMEELAEEERLEAARNVDAAARGTSIVVPRRKPSKEKRRKTAGATAGKVQ